MSSNQTVPWRVFALFITLAIALSGAVWAFSNGTFATKDYVKGIDWRVNRNTDDIREFRNIIREDRKAQSKDFKELRREQQQNFKDFRRLIEKRNQ